MMELIMKPYKIFVRKPFEIYQFDVREGYGKIFRIQFIAESSGRREVD
jgi:hypothetical protein